MLIFPRSVEREAVTADLIILPGPDPSEQIGDLETASSLAALPPLQRQSQKTLSHPFCSQQ